MVKIIEEIEEKVFLHGSRHELDVGDVLVAGSKLGFSDNGGKSDAVYMVMTEGYSLSECEGSEGFNTTFEFAVDEALWWGESFLYVVAPQGQLRYDDHHDVSPACVKADSAKVLKKIDVRGLDFDTVLTLVKNA